MSPANKFWLGVLLLVCIILFIICPILFLTVFIIYQIGVILVYAGNAKWEDDLKNYKNTIFWKTSIPYLICLFNQYLNNKFSKNGKI